MCNGFQWHDLDSVMDGHVIKLMHSLHQELRTCESQAVRNVIHELDSFTSDIRSYAHTIDYAPMRCISKYFIGLRRDLKSMERKLRHLEHSRMVMNGHVIVEVKIEMVPPAIWNI